MQPKSILTNNPSIQAIGVWGWVGKKREGNAAKFVIRSQALKHLQSVYPISGIIYLAEANDAAQRKQKMMILEQQYHDDLKKELRGVMYTSAGSKETSGVVQTGELATNVEENADDMGKLMMSRKRRKLLEAMQISNKRNQARADLIKQRKKKIDEARSQRN
ncbi:hypothetical protein ACSQ67_024762 [Phaseolus vulgaris]